MSLEQPVCRLRVVVPGCCRFAGQTLSSATLVLVTVCLPDTEPGTVTLRVNCEKMVVGNMLLSELRTQLS